MKDNITDPDFSQSVSDSERTIFKCPTCQSERFSIVQTDPPQAKCNDCGHMYNFATWLEPGRGQPKGEKKRQAAPGKRHHVDNGPQELQVSAVPPLTKADLGETTWNVLDIQAGGPKALIAARKQAIKLGARLGEELEQQWFLKTKWLQQLQSTKRGCARVNYALRWRPPFLAALSLTGSTVLACKAATVDYHTYQRHRNEDQDFDAQCVHAETIATEMLYAACYASAVEGDLEPIYWQGIKVGHVRKFSDRLRIEMLRAKLPQQFKTPGTGNVNVHTGPGAQMLIMTPEVQAELVAQRRRNLLAMKAAREAGNPHPELPVE